jgi:hypothetical protein
MLFTCMMFWISGQWPFSPRVLLQLDVLVVHVGPESVRAALHNIQECRVGLSPRHHRGMQLCFLFRSQMVHFVSVWTTGS